jgi:hypothetical protein
MFISSLHNIKYKNFKNKQIKRTLKNDERNLLLMLLVSGVSMIGVR